MAVEINLVNSAPQSFNLNLYCSTGKKLSLMRWKAVGTIETRPSEASTSVGNSNSMSAENRMSVSSNDDNEFPDTLEDNLVSQSILDSKYPSSVEKNLSESLSDYDDSHNNSLRSLESDADDDDTDFEILNCEKAEEDSESFNISGRRIINIAYFLNQLKSLKHKGFDCSFFNLSLVSKKIAGFESIFSFRCDVCNIVQTIRSEDPDEKVNRYKFFVGTWFSLDIPSMSHKTYSKYHNQISNVVNKKNEELMINAGKEEAMMAINR
ncbi:hypothetical protein FQR65_LT09482 [Abscondita terminalis]|nr:hypothetical protein FQR65_LT09482 [Abscondita terminalis]